MCDQHQDTCCMYIFISFSAKDSSEAASSAASTSSDDNDSTELTKTEQKKSNIALIRKQGGLTAFQTKYGALNFYAICYGIIAIGLGLIWYTALTFTQFLYFITGGRIDKHRKLPVIVSHMWGIALTRLTGQYPNVEGRENLEKLIKENRGAMIVANHVSWMDIPWVGLTIGWQNYKMVAKAELLKVPILGKAIALGGNIILDRTSRRSQLMTLKSGIQALKDGLYLVTFPEGTRSRTGRLMKFKNGAFKMAHKNKSPVVPISIVGGDKVNPSNWMFPLRSGKGVAKIVVHEPVESDGISEDELSQTVRKAIIEGLPERQRPLKE
eukprot:CAMPEP_0195281382 /NCGR_PEP_ID=MMETSP0707-20130614/716_1 /TAXON_ID=33640 /ORGANISM="Asterionellopsis glacialis, Strain CCMP134" /LENGTH=324 /DNA_ID=CAMNT_0040340263 /DNA_START=239 /DNA_END=1214 /DNA_ORIENTATION=-